MYASTGERLGAERDSLLMEVRAILRNYRKGPRKIRPVANLVRGLSVAEAETQLAFMNKQCARQIAKLLASAIANAEHNHSLERSNLFVKTIMVDGGPVFKRFEARAHGRASPIRKRTSHVTIVLAERIPSAGAPKAEAAAKSAEPVAVKEETPKAEKPKAKKTAATKTAAPKKRATKKAADEKTPVK